MKNEIIFLFVEINDINSKKKELCVRPLNPLSTVESLDIDKLTVNGNPKRVHYFDWKFNCDWTKSKTGIQNRLTIMQTNSQSFDSLVF